MRNPWILDLLDPELEDYFSRAPKRLEEEYLQKKKKPDWVVLDEIQRVPRLLDLVHRMVENLKVKFILTGSSARKLKRGAANLLAGRAFVHHLFPLTSRELDLHPKSEAALIDYLHWGGLPRLTELKTDVDKARYLRGYELTYLNEEIRAEQLIRKLDPFRSFLEVAAQQSGKIINHKRIASEVGIDLKTVQSYFQILEDTLLGFYLPAFHESVRKSQRLSPKFFFFDTGVKKALEGSLSQRPVPRTSVFGELFESMVLLEIHRMNQYTESDYRLSYFATKNDVEVDLVLSKGRRHTLIEIKSADRIDVQEVASLARLSTSFPGLRKVYYLSRDPHALRIQNIECLHWQEFLKSFFG